MALCNQKKLLAAISAVDPGVSPEALAWIRKPMTRDWQPFAVPGSWIARCVAGNGAVWIRRIVTLPDGWRGKEVVLHLGGIDKQDITFANGVEIGRTGSGTDCSTYDVPRVYAIPPELTAEGTLDLAVRGYSFIYDGSFNGSPDAYHLDCGDERIELDQTALEPGIFPALRHEIVHAGAVAESDGRGGGIDGDEVVVRLFRQGHAHFVPRRDLAQHIRRHDLLGEIGGVRGRPDHIIVGPGRDLAAEVLERGGHFGPGSHVFEAEVIQPGRILAAGDDAVGVGDHQVQVPSGILVVDAVLDEELAVRRFPE